MVEQTKDVSQKVAFANSEDPAFLAVKGHFDTKEDATKYVKGLAQAISVVFQKHQNVKLRCIGAGATNNALKAAAITRLDYLPKGINLVVEPDFTTVSFEDGDRTGMLLKVVEKKS